MFCPYKKPDIIAAYNHTGCCRYTKDVHGKVAGHWHTGDEFG
jgi:hypothetical protein